MHLTAHRIELGKVPIGIAQVKVVFQIPVGADVDVCLIGPSLIAITRHTGPARSFMFNATCKSPSTVETGSFEIPSPSLLFKVFELHSFVAVWFDEIDPQGIIRSC